MEVKLGQQVKVVDTTNPSETLFVGHVAWINKNGSYIVNTPHDNEIHFARSGKIYGDGGPRWYGKTTLFAHPVN